MTDKKQTPEEAFEVSASLLRMAVKAGEMGIFTPDTLRALVKAAAAVSDMYDDPDFRAGAIKVLRERMEGDKAPDGNVVSLFGHKPSGAA